ncbi:hypothetical protein [uncultured Winogradskyella sp.]|uniref:hypothetical protein n=1 Tax=uncultured Winogradskyella sp. TaxID=395353 RepID=UPI002615EC37|nr:hypothetical protein [uncultured Winogradskyella sp.]
MKIRVIFIFLILLTSFECSIAQEYFVFIKKNDAESFKYPENVVMNLIDENGNSRLIRKNDAITVNGKYTLEVKFPLSETMEVIKIDGGTLEIFVLQIDIRKMETYEVENESKEKYDDIKIKSNTPHLVSKEITKSETIKDRYNILLVFEGGLVFKYDDGDARAWEDGDEIKVSEAYNMLTSKGILIISYNPETSEVSWVWE